MTIRESLEKFRQSCKVVYEGEAISEVPLLADYAKFLVDFYSQEGRNVSFSAHTGSVLFDVMALTYGFIRALCGTGQADERGVLDAAGYCPLQDSPLEGAFVYFKPQNYESLYLARIQSFASEHVEVECAWGKKSQLSRIWLPRSTQFLSCPNSENWESPKTRRVLPISRIGITRRRCGPLFQELFGYETPPAKFSSRFVASIPQGVCDQIRIVFHEDVFCLSELQPGAEGVLFCRPYARDLSDLITRNVLSRLTWSGMLLGSHTGQSMSFDEAVSYINERLTLKSLMFNGVGPVQSLCAAAEVEDVKGFVCTRNYMERYDGGILVRQNPSHVQTLANQVHTIARRRFRCLVVDNGGDAEKISDIRSRLYKLSSSDGEISGNDAMRSFLSHAYSLLRLFQMSLVPLCDIGSGGSGGESITHRLDRLKASIEVLPLRTKTAAMCIHAALEAYFQAHGASRTMCEAFNDLECRTPRMRTVVAIPNSFLSLSSLFHRNFYEGYPIRKLHRLSFVSKGQLNRSVEVGTYDALVTVGGTGYYDLQAFDFMSNLIARDVYVLLHSSEVPSLLAAASERRDALVLLGRRAYNLTAPEEEILTDLDSILEDTTLVHSVHNSVYNVKVPTSVEVIDQDPVEMQRQIERQIYRPKTQVCAGLEEYQLRDSSLHVVFEGEGEAFLTRGYRAMLVKDLGDGGLRIFDRARIDEIEAGDLLVFPADGERRLDALDEMIKSWYEHELNDDDRAKWRPQLEDARTWKEKLWEYRDVSGASDRVVARRLADQNDCPVQEAAIMNWLDPDSHTVRPDDLASFVAIGRLVNHQDMVQNPRRYQDACAVIYGLRTQMRDRLRTLLVNRLRSLSGDGVQAGGNTELDSLVRIVRASYLDRTERQVPYTRVNRFLEF